MIRVLLCSVSAVLFTLACGSSSSDSGDNGASGSTSGGSGNAGTSSTSGGSSSAGATSNAGAGGSSAAGASTGGSSGSSGSTGTTTGSVTQWGNDIARSAHFVAPTLTKANASKMILDTFTAPTGNTEYIGKFAGEVAAIPLYLAGKSAGTGEYIAVTTENDVYAFNETTGALNWKHNIGAFRDAAGSCGTPAHHGIISTPVIDEATRTIYVVGGMSAADNHELHALNADTGMELSSPAGFPVNLASINATTGTGMVTMVSNVQNQRSALSLVNGVIYVAFGGYCGDAGQYHGWVSAVTASDPTKTGAWATVDRQAGIWAPGGMASDGNGVFAVTGNSGAMGDHTMSDSEEIIRVTGLGVGNRDAKDMFFPTEWQDPMNAHDLDFGSSSPAVITVPNSTPSSVIVAPSKNGRVYFLDAGNLGASLGQFADMAIADVTGASVYTAPSAYTSTSGVHVALITGAGSQCPSPVGTNDGSVMSFLMQPGTTPDKAPTPKIAWCAKVGTDGTTIRRSPISTNSAGTADPIVWMMNGSKLNGFDGETGAVIFDGGMGTCAGVHTFTSLIVANGHIVIGGDAAGQAHLCSWSIH